MKILSRYVLREHLGPLVFALTALTSLLLLNFIAKRFGDLVGKGLPATVIAEFFLLALPFTVAMTLPMAVLVAVLYAFSRLASESEITALKASGVGMGRIMLPVLGGATVLAIAMVYFNDFVLPEANHRLRILQTDIGRTKPTFALREQVINEVVSGRLFLRARRIDKANNRLHEVVIYDFGDGSKRRTIVADSGDLALVAGTGDLTLMLFHGTMTEIPAATPTQLTRLAYLTDRITVRGVANSFSRDSADSYKSEREMGVCEMQDQVYRAEIDLLRERRGANVMQERAMKALTRGIVQPLLPPDSLKTASPGIGRYYCEAAVALSAFFKRGDSTTRDRGKSTNDPLAASPTIAPVVTPNDAAGTTVVAGVTPGVVPAPPASHARCAVSRPREYRRAAVADADVHTDCVDGVQRCCIHHRAVVAARRHRALDMGAIRSGDPQEVFTGGGLHRLRAARRTDRAALSSRRRGARDRCEPRRVRAVLCMSDCRRVDGRRRRAAAVGRDVGGQHDVHRGRAVSLCAHGSRGQHRTWRRPG